jgi:hypothetical protein
MPSRFFPLYNIDQPIGPGQPNKRDDVRLVQALFIEVSRFDVNDWFQEVPQQARSLKTSGVFDENLKQWILALQRWSVKSYGSASFKADGIIHPMPIQNIALTPHFKSGRISTLAFLCNRLWRWNRAAYLRIGDDYNVPWVPEGWVP